MVRTTRLHRHTAGFTIVELLIVITVIGILAGIVLVAYNGIQGRAYDASVKSDLSSFADQLETFRTESATDVYPTAAQLISGAGVQLSKGAYVKTINNILYCRVNDGKEYGLAAGSKAGHYFYINSSSTSGPSDYTWSWTQASATTCNNVISASGYAAGYTSDWGWTSGGTAGWASPAP